MEVTEKESVILLEALRSTKCAKLENLEQLRVVKDDLANNSLIPEATSLRQTMEQSVSDLHTLDRLIKAVEKGGSLLHIKNCI
jgi:hypothetical protein